MAPPPNPIPPSGDSPFDGPNGRPKPENRALRRTVVRPAGMIPDPVDGAFIATRLTTLVHELATLIDASMRVISLARRSLHPDEAASDRMTAKDRDVCPQQLERQLETVDAAMHQMAELVRSSMIGLAEGGMAGVRMGFGASSSLSDAIRHAVEVMTPFADEHCVRLGSQVAGDLAEIAAGPIYAVITNGVRNAVESIHRAGNKHPGGTVVVRAWMESGKTGRCVMVTIEDDGEGLGGGGKRSASGKPPRRSGPSRADNSVFRLGYTTKPGGSGIGLSLCRDVIEQLGGTIELLSRARDPKTGRGGAVLSICYPVPDAGRLF
jgi:signal transduction histidine kinase